MQNRQDQSERNTRHTPCKVQDVSVTCGYNFLAVFLPSVLVGGGGKRWAKKGNLAVLLMYSKMDKVVVLPLGYRVTESKTAKLSVLPSLKQT